MSKRSKSAIYYEEGQLESAIRCSQKSLDLDPCNGLPWWNIACAHAQTGDRDACLSALQSGIEMRPELARRMEAEESLQPFIHEASFQALLSQNQSSL